MNLGIYLFAQRQEKGDVLKVEVILKHSIGEGIDTTLLY